VAAATLDLRESEDGVTLKVRVQPRASRDALAGNKVVAVAGLDAATVRARLGGDPPRS